MPFYQLFWGGFPNKIDYRTKSWYPYSKLSNLEDLVNIARVFTSQFYLVAGSTNFHPAPSRIFWSWIGSRPLRGGAQDPPAQSRLGQGARRHSPTGIWGLGSLGRVELGRPFFFFFEGSLCSSDLCSGFGGLARRNWNWLLPFNPPNGGDFSGTFFAASGWF